MADVYCIKDDPLKNRYAAAKVLLDQSGVLGSIERGDLVAIKLNIGEIGSPYHVDPLLVRIIAGCIREKGGDPFMTDSTTYYVYKRHNALDYIRTATWQGFSHETVGAPFIVADGLGFSPGIPLRGKGLLREVYMAELFYETKFLFVLSHCKGHPLTSFGGALKNVGMGCVTKRTKLEQHRTVGYSLEQDSCTGCGKCGEVCPFHLPQVRDGKATMESPLCMRCQLCRDNCPQGAIKLTGVGELQKAVASASAAVLQTFGKKAAFFNVAMNISKYCDCTDAPGEIIAGNMGYFASLDPVAVDRAFVEAIGAHTLKKIHGIDPEIILKEAERLGAGEDRVELKTVTMP